LKRFQQNLQLEKEYEKAMEKYFDHGHASYEEDEGGIFLPRDGVYKNTIGPRKPALLNHQLRRLLIKFREGAVAFAADIEAMFSHIQLRV